MNEHTAVTCCIRRVNGKFFLIAHITEQWYFSLETRPENITMTPITEREIQEMYPFGLLPD